MRPDDLAALFDHLYWVRDRILAAADGPDVPWSSDAHATVRDLRATLVHELDVEWSWRERLAASDRTRFATDAADLDARDFPSVEAIRTRWAADAEAMRTWLASLSSAQLDGPCGVERTGSHPLWFHLLHLYSHALQQFSDAAVNLTLAGRSPGEIDFLEFADARTTRGGEAASAHPRPAGEPAS